MLVVSEMLEKRPYVCKILEKDIIFSQFPIIKTIKVINICMILNTSKNIVEPLNKMEKLPDYSAHYSSLHRLWKLKHFSQIQSEHFFFHIAMPL